MTTSLSCSMQQESNIRSYYHISATIAKTLTNGAGHSLVIAYVMDSYSKNIKDVINRFLEHCYDTIGYNITVSNIEPNEITKSFYIKFRLHQQNNVKDNK